MLGTDMGLIDRQVEAIMLTEWCEMMIISHMRRIAREVRCTRCIQVNLEVPECCLRIPHHKPGVI